MGQNAANMKYALVTRTTATLSIAVSGTPQVVPFEAPLAGGCNLFNMWEGTTNPSRITCVRAGFYVAFTAIEFAASATGDRTIGFRKNGVASLIGGQTNKSATLAQEMTSTAVILMASGDYLEVWVNQTSAGALNVTTTAAKQSPAFGLFMLRSGPSVDFSAAAQTGFPL